MAKLLIASVAAVLGLSSPAIAQSTQPAQPGQAQQQGTKPARDPNEIVCERQQQLGSRLATERVCKTRAEWAEERRAQRMDVDKAQMQRDLSH